jgi:colanic acid/amylovoran biosynthesis protein
VKILLVNPHSPQNAGDLAILHSALARLAEAFPHADLAYTMTDDQPSPWVPRGVPGIPSSMQWVTRRTADGGWRWRKGHALGYVVWLLLIALFYRIGKWRWLPADAQRRAWMQAYYDADVIVGNGGGYLYARNQTSIAFLWLWLGMALAIIMGKPLILLPQSFGPLPGRLQQTLLRWLVNRADLVGAREFRSVEFLQTIHVQSPVLLLPDLAFLTVESDRDEALDLLARFGVPRDDGRPKIGMTLMDWGAQNPAFSDQAAYEAGIVQLIQFVQEHYNAHVILFAQCCGPTPDQDDRHISRRIAGLMAPVNPVYVIDAMLPASMLKAAYRAIDALVATRMHAAIFSLAAQTPTLVIGYLHKSIGIMQTVGLGQYVTDIGAVSSDRLCQQFAALWAERQTIHQRLLERIPPIQSTLAHLPHLIRMALEEHA